MALLIAGGFFSGRIKFNFLSPLGTGKNRNGSETLFGKAKPMTIPTDEKAGIVAAVQAWIDAFNAHDPLKVASLYDDAAVLWGTLSQEIIFSSGGVQAYFERTFQMTPPPTVRLGAHHVRLFGEVAVSSGSYTLGFVVDGRAEAVPARFSFTWYRPNGKWLIVDHHSSLLPSIPPGLFVAQ